MWSNLLGQCLACLSALSFHLLTSFLPLRTLPCATLPLLLETETRLIGNAPYSFLFRTSDGLNFHNFGKPVLPLKNLSCLFVTFLVCKYFHLSLSPSKRKRLNFSFFFFSLDLRPDRKQNNNGRGFDDSSPQKRFLPLSIPIIEKRYSGETRTLRCPCVSFLYNINSSALKRKISHVFFYSLRQRPDGKRNDNGRQGNGGSSRDSSRSGGLVPLKKCLLSLTNLSYL